LQKGSCFTTIAIPYVAKKLVSWQKTILANQCSILMQSNQESNACKSKMYKSVNQKLIP